MVALAVCRNMVRSRGECVAKSERSTSAVQAQYERSEDGKSVVQSQLERSKNVICLKQERAARTTTALRSSRSDHALQTCAINGDHILTSSPVQCAANPNNYGERYAQISSKTNKRSGRGREWVATIRKCN